MPRLARVTKKGASLMQSVQSGEVQITPVHQVERTDFHGQHVQHTDLVGLAVADMDEGRNAAPQIQQGMQLDGRLGGLRDRVGKVDAKAVVAIKLARAANEHCRQIGPDAPIASFVGIGQRGAPDQRSKAHAVQLGLIDQKTGFDVAQTLAISQLRKRHGTELFGTTQTSYARVAAMTRHEAGKARPWHELHNLREHSLARIHKHPPEESTSESYSNMNGLISNRHQNNLLENPRQNSISAQSLLF